MGLRLDRREPFFRGGDDGPVVVPGNPDKSLLIQAVRHSGDVKMPPNESLSDTEIATLTDWVKSGAPWPDDQVLNPAAAAANQAKQHWAFQPVHQPPRAGGEKVGLGGRRRSISLFWRSWNRPD